MKELIREICPPIIWKALTKIIQKHSRSAMPQNASSQNLDVYWDEQMAQILETWGEGNAWNEIQLILSCRHGKVIDIACGTGKVIDILKKYPNLDVHGCDISDLLLSKAENRGISQFNLSVQDATRMNYEDNSFDWGYSIGSLEHFTETGIDQFLLESKRIVKNASFHMIPVSRSNYNEGWITTLQSYFNNSSEWWINKCRNIYPEVYILESSWSDPNSTGVWLVCVK